MSSGFYGSNNARIFINEEPIVLEKNESDHLRGLHIAIIDPSNAKVVFAKVFDTADSSMEFDMFI